MIKIGVIADDFTGATDIASFLVENGLPTVQINGVSTGKMPEAIDALVISLKTRSCPVVEATQQSLAALSWLQQQGCKQIYFKYCSTFDSTAKVISARLPMINGCSRHAVYGLRPCRSTDVRFIRVFVCNESTAGRIRDAPSPGKSHDRQLSSPSG
ncbi:four-carbon acid sugar kinase family protein [Escherichia coli]